MQTVTLHKQFRSIAKQGGVMPSYWSAIETCLSNDRLPNRSGFKEVMYS